MRSIYLAIRMFLYAIISFLTIGCENPVSNPGFDSTPPEKSVTFHSINSTQSTTSRAISKWSTAKNISGDITINQTDNYLHGPKMSISNWQDSYISWGVYDNSSIVNGNYTSGTNYIFKGNDVSGWFSDNPQGDIPSPSAFLPQISANKITGEAFSIWQDTGVLYASYFHPETSWSKNEILGNSELALISPVFDSEVSSIWVNDKNNMSFSINISNYSIGNGWSTPTSFFRPNGQLMHALIPVKISSIRTLFVWVEKEQQKFPKLMSIEHDKITGWKNPILIRELAITTNIYYSGYNLKSIGKTGGAMLVYEIKENGNIDGVYAHKFIGNNPAGGIWEDVVILDDATSNSIHPHSDMVALASNEKGELAALWTKNKIINNQEIIVLIVNRYSPTSGWSKPEQAVQPLLRYPLESPQDPGPFNFIHGSHITIDSTGEINIAWNQFSNVSSNAVSHQLLTTLSADMQGGWIEPMVLDTSNNYYPLIVDLSMDVGTNGTINIAWRHEVRDLETGVLTNYSIWTSQKNGKIPQ